MQSVRCGERCSPCRIECNNRAGEARVHTVTIRPVVDRPELIRRKHFKEGEFTLQGLTRNKYKIVITAPQLVGVKLDVDFGNQRTDYRIAILHHPRSGPNPMADARFPAALPALLFGLIPEQLNFAL